MYDPARELEAVPVESGVDGPAVVELAFGRIGDPVAAGPTPEPAVVPMTLPVPEVPVPVANPDAITAVVMLQTYQSHNYMLGCNLLT